MLSDGRVFITEMICILVNSVLGKYERLNIFIFDNYTYLPLRNFDHTYILDKNMDLTYRLSSSYNNKSYTKVAPDGVFENKKAFIIL